MTKTESPDMTFEAFRKLVPYLRGSLWWVRNDVLKERQRTFNPWDAHVGHPVLSVRSLPLGNRSETIPMLVGTSANWCREDCKSEFVKVLGLTAKDPEHLTYFGSIVEPGQYTFDDLLDGVVAKNDIETVNGAKRGDPAALRKSAWHEARVMYPNWDKPTVTASERTDLNNFCMKHGI